jgi:ABC-2 type transport system ATP-binding protein
MIEVESLSRYYGTHRAVDNVSFTIGKNAVVGFLGLNGAGKTTTLKVIAGLLAPSSGSVRIDGVDMTTAAVSFRQRIGFMPETPPLYTEMTVSAYLRYLGQLRGMPSAAVEARLPSVLERCQLAGQANRVIDELSHGFRKRVGIAQSIIHKPSLVILDEPISGLDPVQIVEMRKVIRSLGDECTVLVSSHILPEVSQTCDRILVLRKGKLIADGTEEQLANRFHRSEVISVVVHGSKAKLEATLQSSPIVSSFTITGGTDDRPAARVEMKGDQREELVRLLLGAGFGLRRLEDASDELEDIFMDLNREGAA